MLRSYIAQLQKRQSLSLTEATAAFEALFATDNTAQQGAFLALLSSKGETVNELVALVSVVRSQGTPLAVGYPTLDIVGTGGDGQHTLNISTASALLLAKCGIPVLKGGNRAISSQTGGADVLEALGYSVDLTPAETIAALQQRQFGFCLAPQYYPILNKVRDVRKALSFATIFNLLGPLLNPAGLRHSMIGVYDHKRLRLVADSLATLGTNRSLVFHGSGLDELSCLGKSDAYLISGSQVESITIDPQAFGLKPCTLIDLKGADAQYNARVIYQTLSGTPTGLTDTLLLNAGAGLFIFGKASTISEGVNMARTRLAAGNVLPRNRLLEILIRKTRTTQATKSFKQALLAKSPGAVIAEIKRASPSAGKIATIEDPVSRAKLYVDSGAAAISVLTDENFAGSIKDLEQVSQALRNTQVPVLRKDFILYPEQIVEAKMAGADVVLLMVSALGKRTKTMVELAHVLGLEALVEAHSAAELSIALVSGGDVLGINQRDLRDFTMHPELFSILVKQCPSGIVTIAESGIKTAADAQALFAMGYHGVLVGETLSKLPDPTQFFKELYHAN